MQMAEMGRKIASDMTAATGAQASVEAQAAAAADRAKLEHRLAQLSAEVNILASAHADAAEVAHCLSHLLCWTLLFHFPHLYVYALNATTLLSLHAPVKQQLGAYPREV